MMEETSMAEQPKSETLEPEASKSTMPFADLTKRMAELYPGKLMEQLTKTFGEYPLPGINIDTLLQSHRKNVEALGAANKRLLENAETVMNRQGEILRQMLEEGSAALKALSSADNPADLATKQREIFRHIVLHTLENMREVAEMTAQSSREAFEIVNERGRENVEDIRGMLRQQEK
jgi:phasin family protein